MRENEEATKQRTNGSYLIKMFRRLYVKNHHKHIPMFITILFPTAKR
jgi:hypothetical protein